MRILRATLAVLLACCFALPGLAEKPGVIVVNSATKELKRSAHRLRIPVDQLKNARKAFKMVCLMQLIQAQMQPNF